MTAVVVVVGAGSIGRAIARRVGAGRIVVLADRRPELAAAAAGELADAGFAVETATVDIASRDSVEALTAKVSGLGPIAALVHAAGVSPSQAPVETILRIDLYGTALLLEVFGEVVGPGAAGLVISSQSGHRLAALTAQQDRQLATAPVEELLLLPWLHPAAVADPLLAYQLAKRGNGLRVQAEAVRWGRRGARLNAISPGIVMTPLARDELNGPRGDGYRRMIETSLAGRAATPDEIATMAALMLGPDGSFITGSDVLMDGGTTAVHWFG